MLFWRFGEEQIDIVTNTNDNIWVSAAKGSLASALGQKDDGISDGVGRSEASDGQHRQRFIISMGKHSANGGVFLVTFSFLLLVRLWSISLSFTHVGRDATLLHRQS